MDDDLTRRHPRLASLVESLRERLGAGFVSAVVFGSAARGDAVPQSSDVNLMLVFDDLSPATLDAAAGTLKRWLRHRQPMPVLFSRASLAGAVDAFPIEFLEISEYRVVVHGEDPLRELRVSTADLRLQCERELREKLMRLREGYVLNHGSRRKLRRLLAESYPSFAAIFRGALRLLGESPPAASREVMEAFCARAGLELAPFAEIAAMRRREVRVADPEALFASYHEQLVRAVSAVDRFADHEGGR